MEPSEESQSRDTAELIQEGGELEMRRELQSWVAGADPRWSWVEKEASGLGRELQSWVAGADLTSKCTGWSSITPQKTVFSAGEL